jgi:adenine-specific DNA-methyltransferase
MTNYEKLIDTLREAFMLDKAELDFGIYRIMNQKRKDIEQFLEKDLIPQVREILQSNSAVDVVQLEREIQHEIETAKKYGNPNPELLAVVQELREKLNQANNMTELENEVFSLLSNFFKRYFEKGDFISMRRYKKDVYAIPYEGEEVKLHWANADQYYIKSSENFKIYRFKLSNGKSVAFELLEATTEQNNNKSQGDKERKFAIVAENPCEVVEEELKIYFNYEPMDKKVKQDDLLKEAFKVVKDKIPSDFAELLSLRPTDKDKQRTLLQKNLTDYTAKNTFDYFIHKDLNGFLTRELDFYIKNEVLFIDDINTRDEQAFVRQLSKIKATKKIGEKIITFLAQIEDFQKKLWLKKKMVVECNYCITLDRVPEKFYTEIANNQAQINEWISLFAIDEIKGSASADMFSEKIVGFSSPLTSEFLKQNPFLVLDTAFFNSDFKWKLISEIEDFDEKCDGLLINSDNFQSLNFIKERYKNSIKGIYIDPPYNTGGDDFIYKDNFQHSSWLSMMIDRLSLSKSFIREDGTYSVSIDLKEI